MTLLLNHVAVRASSAVDVRAARRAIDQLQVDVEFNAAEILLLRHVADPLPGRILEGARLNPRWRQALDNELVQQRRRAVRPGLGMADADAIVFASGAELLATLMRTPVHASPWWWPGALAHLGVTRFDLSTLLCAQPRFVPAAFALLTASQALHTVAQLEAQELQRVCIAVLQAFEVRTDAPVHLPGMLAGTQASGGEFARALHRLAAANLEDEARLLTASRPRTGQTGSEFTSAPGGHAGDAAPPGEASTPRPERLATDTLSSRPLIEEMRPRFVALMRALGVAPQAIAGADAATLESIIATERARLGVPAVKPDQRPAESAQDNRQGANAQIRADELPAQAPQTPVSPVTPQVPGQTGDAVHEVITEDPLDLNMAVHTGLAGVFYLLNVFAPSAAARPWAWLAQVARHALRLDAHTSDQEWQADPLWRLLDDLDDESAAVAGAAMTAEPLDDIAFRTATRQVSGAFDLARDEAWQALLVLPGRVYAGAAHVDVLMSLQDIRLPTRLMGWDMNPGWRADFGRIFTFHYRAQDERG